MFWLKTKKVVFLLRTLNLSPAQQDISYEPSHQFTLLQCNKSPTFLDRANLRYEGKLEPHSNYVLALQLWILIRASIIEGPKHSKNVAAQ